MVRRIQFFNKYNTKYGDTTSSEFHRMFSELDEADKDLKRSSDLDRTIYYFHTEVIHPTSKFVDKPSVKRWAIFDIKVPGNEHTNDALYCCFLEMNYDSGCDTCNFDESIDDRMHIAHNFYILVMHVLPDSFFASV